MEHYEIDFAISYAGEDEVAARELNTGLKELGFTTFFAPDQRHELVGQDGEVFFESLFSTAKVVVAFISRAYRDKPWTRFEWDVIKERSELDRYIPIRVDNTKILGLSSNIFYITLDSGYDDATRACAAALHRYESARGIERATVYESILRSIQQGSRGSLDRAFQLAKDKRQRDPLEDIQIPSHQIYIPLYEKAATEWFNFSVVRRANIRVLVPPGLRRDELRWNLVHCCATYFNALKPDAISIMAFRCGKDPSVDGQFTAGMVEFAPHGDWGEAEHGVAYNLPVSAFEHRFRWEPSYKEASP